MNTTYGIMSRADNEDMEWLCQSCLWLNFQISPIYTILAGIGDVTGEGRVCDSHHDDSTELWYLRQSFTVLKLIYVALNRLCFYTFDFLHSDPEKIKLSDVMHCCKTGTINDLSCFNIIRLLIVDLCCVK